MDGLTRTFSLQRPAITVSGVPIKPVEWVRAFAAQTFGFMTF
jgi:hypothetical protein